MAKVPGSRPVVAVLRFKEPDVFEQLDPVDKLIAPAQLSFAGGITTQIV
jgi:hypothetical protein